MAERLTELIDLRLELRGRVTTRLLGAAVRGAALVHGCRQPPGQDRRMRDEGRARRTARSTRRLKHRFRHCWLPRSRPEPDRVAPDAVPGLESKIARIKNCALAVCTPEIAAAYMDAMDDDAHLFTDRDSGQTRAVRGSGPTGCHLGRAEPEPRGRRAPVLRRATTGRGHPIYRRYDGHYALTTGDPVPQATAQPDAGREAKSRVLTGTLG